MFMQEHSILDASRGSEYACLQIASNNVLCHHNNDLIGYFEFIDDSRIICLPLNVPEKLHWQHLFENPEEAETYRLYLSQSNTIPTHPKEQHLPFKQTGTTTIFLFGYQSSTWPRSDPFCWQNPCSGSNSGIHLLFVLEYTFFQLFSNTKQISQVEKIQKKPCKPLYC